MAKIELQEVLEKLNFIEEITLNALNKGLESHNNMDFERNQISELIHDERLRGIKFAMSMIKQFSRYTKDELEKLKGESE